MITTKSILSPLVVGFIILTVGPSVLAQNIKSDSSLNHKVPRDSSWIKQRKQLIQLISENSLRLDTLFNCDTITVKILQAGDLFDKDLWDFKLIKKKKNNFKLLTFSYDWDKDAIKYSWCTRVSTDKVMALKALLVKHNTLDTTFKAGNAILTYDYEIVEVSNGNTITTLRFYNYEPKATEQIKQTLGLK